MQVSVENAGALERRLVVQIPEERVATRVSERLQELTKSVKVDGFRPGKAPAKVVERRYGPRVREEVVSDLLRSSYAEALQAEKLRPVSDPEIGSFSAEPGQGLSYTASFEIYPEVQLAAIEALQIERPICEVGEADIDKMVEVLRGQHKQWKEVARPSQNGDQVVIDFEGSIDGTVFPGGTATDFDLVLGDNRMIEGFESGLVGRSAGDDVTLNLSFPEAYRNAELAGKAVEFKIKLKRVSEPELPALDEAFFEKFGVTAGGLVAFREEVRDNMIRERDRALQRRFNSGVLGKLSEAHTLDLPKALVEAEMQRMQAQNQQALMMRGLNPQQIGAGGPELYADPAAKRVKLGLVMAEMIRHAGIAADPGKVRALVEGMAASYEDADAVVKWYYADPRRLQEIEALCLEDEAVAWIASKAQVSEVSLSFDDLMNPGQTDHKAGGGT
ncbi:MAG: trigger factor [Gammaproteobacteria bacterium]|nr:trigger factor [Gammaproteobacteria bacterium]